MAKGFTTMKFLVGGALLMASLSTGAQLRIERKPASIIPNDDVIVVPVAAQMSFYERHVANDKNWKDVGRVELQIKLWQENANLAQQYGLDADSIGSRYYVPTSDEKWEYISRSYMRYLRRKGEEPLKDGSKEWFRQWNADKEVNSIDEMEATFKATNKKSQYIPSSLQEREIGKTKKFRMYFQPRVEQGLLIVRMTSALVDGRAWIGINGESEVNLQRRFNTGTRLMFNYFTHNQQYLTSIDQSLGGGFSARFIHSFDPDLVTTRSGQENRIQFGYNAEF
jgi:hypothetical protein